MTKVFSSAIFVVTLFITSALIAQPTGGGPGDGGDPDVPIGGVEILLAAGLAYGLKKIVGGGKNQSHN